MSAIDIFNIHDIIALVSCRAEFGPAGKSAWSTESIDGGLGPIQGTALAVILQSRDIPPPKLVISIY